MAIEHCNMNLLSSYIWQKLAQYFQFVIGDWSHKQFRDIKKMYVFLISKIVSTGFFLLFVHSSFELQFLLTIEYK